MNEERIHRLIYRMSDRRLNKVIQLINDFDQSYSGGRSLGYSLLRRVKQKKRIRVNVKDKNHNTPLHFFVRNGNVKSVKLLLNLGANINSKNSDGITPLHVASKREDLQIVKLLLNHGARVNSISRKGYSALHLAAGKGSEEIVKLLLSKNAHIDGNAENNLTPLYIATKKKHEKVVQLLLNNGANVNVHDKDGQTVLHFAAENGHLMIIEHILKHNFDVKNKSNSNSLNAAALASMYYNCKYKVIIEILLQHGFAVNPKHINDSKLMYAALTNGYLKIVKELLKYGADVNMSYHDCTLLHSASEYKQFEVATLLINYGADVNARNGSGKTPIFYAVGHEDMRFVQPLLISNYKESCKEFVEILLQNGADINGSDVFGRTPLYFAIGSPVLIFYNKHRNFKEEMGNLLLSRGADANAQTNEGVTILHVATREGYEKLAENLLKCGADVDSKDKNGVTPLHIASQTRFAEEAVLTLLKYGANINIMNKNNHTPLKYVRGMFSGNEKALSRHIVKMMIANLHVCTENIELSSITRRYFYNCDNSLRSECQKEIDSMKSDKISNSVSLYDILTKSTSQCAIYAKKRKYRSDIKT